MQAQVDQLIRLIHLQDDTHDAQFLAELDTFSIPTLGDWLAAYFPPSSVDRLLMNYEKAFAEYRSHVYWAMGNFARKSDLGIRVESSELPTPLADVGFEALVRRPIAAIKIENFRFSPTKDAPPSWVSSFAYVDGRFRFVGGTYPFWDETLPALRGPMAIPAETSGDLTIQAVPFTVDPKTPGVVAIVVLTVRIGADGRAYGFTLDSGDHEYVKQAEDYVRDWEFFHMATEYPLSVVFFKTAR
jgi:hypothetical protein